MDNTREFDGPALRAFLDSRGTRYGWVADQLHLSRGHFSLILSGARPLPWWHAMVVASIFDVSVDELLGRSKPALGEGAIGDD